MSINCQVKDIGDKLKSALEGLLCPEEGEELNLPCPDPNAPIACQLDSLLELACLIQEQTVCGSDCEVEACFRLKGLDIERGVNGFWNSGSFGATVNNVTTSTPWNFNSDVGKSKAYQAMLDQINATPGWSVTVVNEASMETNDLVEFEFKYCGPADGAVLKIVRTTGTPDQIGLNANTGVGVFVDDQGDEISSGRQPVAC